jgi:hypothetical protein
MADTPPYILHVFAEVERRLSRKLSLGDRRLTENVVRNAELKRQRPSAVSVEQSRDVEPLIQQLVTTLSEVRRTCSSRRQWGWGRAPKDKKAGDLMVLVALQRIHRWTGDGAVGRTAPAKRLLDIADLAQVSRTTVSTFLQSRLGRPAWKRYRQCCRSEHIRSKLRVWSSEFSAEHLELARKILETRPDG